VISQLPVDEQLDAFHEVLSRNEVLTEVLSRSASLGLPGWYLTAGCLLQTAWNAVTSPAPGGVHSRVSCEVTPLRWWGARGCR
jgi:uncharacterized protein